MRTNLCPLCNRSTFDELVTVPLTYGGEQAIFQCVPCGMIYASVGEAVDYDKGSIYAQPGAVGGRATPADTRRFEGIIEQMIAQGVLRDASILDIGCSQGALAEVFKAHGFSGVTGMDPSAECVRICREKNQDAVQGTPGKCKELDGAKFDVVILSHVLEHIEDIHGFLDDVQRYVWLDGFLYVEVPDADRYVSYDAPFLDFNSEHINHFTEDTLELAIRRHMSILQSPRKRMVSFSHQGGDGYPAIYLLAAHRSRERANVMRYILKSRRQLHMINSHLERELREVSGVAIWGVNSFCANITSLPVFQRVKIVQAVDRNPSLWGKVAHCGVTVESPDSIRPNVPIVVTSMMAKSSIASDIAERKLSNNVVLL